MKMTPEPHITTKAAAEKFMANYNRLGNIGRQCSCYNGHFECSTTDNGPCMDETLSAFPELAE
jgi:hypothetical protein